MPFELNNLFGWLARKMKRPSVPSPVSFDRPLDGALQDAELLLAFAVQSRRSLKGELVAKLAQASETLQVAFAARRLATAAERTAFWQAYDELAVVMAPLSAHSIRSSVSINAKRFPSSLFSPPAMLALVAIAVFAFCMVVQSFWVAGKSLLDAADAVDAQRVELAKKHALSLQAASSAENKFQQFMSELGEKGWPSLLSTNTSTNNRSTADTAEMARLNVQQGILRADFSDKRLITDQQNSELEEANRNGRPLQGLLRQWHGRAHSICDKTVRFLCPVDNNDEDQKVLKEGLNRSSIGAR